MIKYDLLVGSDGAGSCVRQALAEILPPGFCRIRAADNAYAMTPLPTAELGTKTYSMFQMHAFKVQWREAAGPAASVSPPLIRTAGALLQHALCIWRTASQPTHILLSVMLWGLFETILVPWHDSRPLERAVHRHMQILCHGPATPLLGRNSVQGAS